MRSVFVIVGFLAPVIALALPNVLPSEIFTVTRVTEKK